MNKKAFTLIELLAVIIILGVLLLVAVPSVSKYIQQSRIKTYASNLDGFVTAVSNEINSGNSIYQGSADKVLVIPFSCIELEKGSNTKSPFGEYDQSRSYVTVAFDGTKYVYEIAALDEIGYGTRETNIKNITIESLNKADVPKLWKNGTEVKLGNRNTLEYQIPDVCDIELDNNNQ